MTKCRFPGAIVRRPTLPAAGVFCTADFLLFLPIPGYMVVIRRIMRQRYFAAHYKAVMAQK